MKTSICGVELNFSIYRIYSGDEKIVPNFNVIDFINKSVFSPKRIKDSLKIDLKFKIVLLLHL